MVIVNRSFSLCLIILIFLNISCSSDNESSDVDSSHNENSVDQNKVYPYGVSFESQQELKSFLAEGYTEINGNLTFLGNKIIDVSECTQIKKIRGPLFVIGTDLKNLNGLQNLNIMDTTQAIITIDNNPKLENIEGLSGISQDLTIINIDQNPNLISVKGVENITRIKRSLKIGFNENLKNLDPFVNVRGEIKYVHIFRSGIENTHGLSQVVKIIDLEITDNPRLTSISFPSLKITERFYVAYNNSLLEIINLPNFIKASGFTLYENPFLEDISGFENLEGNQYSNVNIIKNFKLENFCPLYKIANISTIADFNIEYNLYNPSKEQIKTDKCRLSE